MYHSKLLTEGEPTGVVDYATSDILPSTEGFPRTKDGNKPTSPGENTDPNSFNGGDCLDLWRSLLNTDLTIAPHQDSDPVYGHKDDIVAWFNGDKQCYYYYTKGFEAREKLPTLYYSPITGEFIRDMEIPSA